MIYWLLIKNMFHKRHNSKTNLSIMKIKTLIYPALLYLTIFFVGCKGQTAKEAGDSDSIDNDSTKTEIDKVKETDKEPQSAVLLFDASGSMQGYLNSKDDSRFVGVISAFENIANNTEICLYGKTEGKPMDKENFDVMLNKRKIEWSNESNLKAMVESMIGHVDNDKVCFLVTDGILSGSDADIKGSPDGSYNIKMRQKMSEDILALFRNQTNKLSALIVRYKAKFNGIYSCYNNEGKSLQNKERPFFVIALGKWNNIKFIEKKLNEVGNVKGVSTPYEDILMIGDSVSYQKVHLTPAEGINIKNKEYIIKKDYKNENIVLSADLMSLPAYMQSENYMKDNTELLIKHGNQNQKLLDKEYYEVEVNNQGGKYKLKLRVKASQLKNSEIVFKLKYSLPEWIGQKSDDNDLDIASNATKQSKTFNLKFLIAGFTSLHNGKYIKEQNLKFK